MRRGAWARRAAWRCKLRVGTANCIAGGCKGCILAAEAVKCTHLSHSVCKVCIDAVHARGGAGDCETRRSRFNYVRAEVLSEACQTVRSKSLPCFLTIRPKES